MLKKRKKTKLKQSLIDKAVSYFNPVAGFRRSQARSAMARLSSYDGASRSKRSLKEWSPLGYDADSDINPDLVELRQRSRDLTRNNPLAASAVKTKVTNVIGAGFLFKSAIDRDYLGLTSDEADTIEAQIEREYRLFWSSKDLDITRVNNGRDITRLVYQQSKENGDVFIVLPRKKLPGAPYSLRLQVVEADRVCNKDHASDSASLSGGVKKDSDGAPVAYHILKQHPGSMVFSDYDWQEVPAFGAKTGLRNVIHLYNPTRPGQSRGVPDIAPVIEAIKQLGRYTEAEIMAAVISGMFTVFVESPTGDGGFDISQLDDETGQTSSDTDLKLGNGLVVELGEGQQIKDANPGRPNTSFDPFVLAITRQIGAALEIPFEVLTKHFTASYSAARAALLSMWQYVTSERQWLADNFLKLVFEVWMHEAVALGRVSAPGFLTDPAIRQAYLGCEFIGPSKGQINELVEVNAAIARVEAGLSTRARETAELNGGDWERNHTQQVKEHKKRLEDGLIQEAAPVEVKIDEQ